MSTGQRRSRLCRGGGPGASHRPRFPSSPPVPSASGPLPRAPLPGRGVTWPRRRGSTAGVGTAAAPGAAAATGPGHPFGTVPHPGLSLRAPRIFLPSSQPRTAACIGSRSPSPLPRSGCGAGAWCWFGTGGCSLRGAHDAPRRLPRRDGPAAPRRSPGLTGAVLPPQAKSSHEVKLKARNDQ